jgi:prepilin-type N-terminal cleavage/methylation domain-containing protein
VRQGYSLVEIIVAILLFTVGVLGVASSSAVIGRALTANVVRERAARVAATRIERLAAECHSASSGSEVVEQIESRWTVSRPESARIDIVETVSYPSARGLRTDSYRSLITCP